MDKILKVISIGYDGTCVLELPNGETVKLNINQVQDLSNYLSDVCYTMGFKYKNTEENFKGALNSGFFGRLVPNEYDSLKKNDVNGVIQR